MAKISTMMKQFKKLIFDDIQGFESCCDRRVSMKELKKSDDTDVRVLVEQGKNKKNEE